MLLNGSFFIEALFCSLMRTGTILETIDSVSPSAAVALQKYVSLAAASSPKRNSEQVPVEIPSENFSALCTNPDLVLLPYLSCSVLECGSPLKKLERRNLIRGCVERTKAELLDL
jgi:hypothetical protein